MKILSICIPTFNRPDKLIGTLSALIPQLKPTVEIVILDNASSPEAFEEIKRFICKDVSLTLLRNPGNIGANANILRCLELGRAPWVWLLGDDDVVENNAIANILDVIQLHPTSSCINFYTPRSIHAIRKEDVILASAAEFMGRAKCIGELMLMSNCILRREVACLNLRYGYHAIDSLCPHLAVMLWSISAGSPAVLSARTIVVYGGTEDSNPSFVSVGMGLSKVFELIWPTGVYEVLCAKGACDFSSWVPARKILLTLLSNWDYRDRAQRCKIKTFSRRMVALNVGFSARLVAITCSLPLGDRLVKLGLSFIGKSWREQGCQLDGRL